MSRKNHGIKQAPANGAGSQGVRLHFTHPTAAKVGVAG
jgi:hypothetical protein